MAASLTRTLRQAGLVLAVAVAVSALSSTASFAFTAEVQQMCIRDALGLCSSDPARSLRSDRNCSKAFP